MSDALLDALAERLTEPVAQRVAELLAQRAAASQSATGGAERLLSCAEAAERARVHVETIRRAIRSGALSAARAGRVLRISPDDLSQWLSRPEATTLWPRDDRPRARPRPLRDALARLGPRP